MKIIHFITLLSISILLLGLIYISKKKISYKIDITSKDGTFAINEINSPTNVEISYDEITETLKLPIDEILDTLFERKHRCIIILKMNSDDIINWEPKSFREKGHKGSLIGHHLLQMAFSASSLPYVEDEIAPISYVPIKDVIEYLASQEKLLPEIAPDIVPSVATLGLPEKVEDRISQILFSIYVRNDRTGINAAEEFIERFRNKYKGTEYGDIFSVNENFLEFVNRERARRKSGPSCL